MLFQGNFESFELQVRTILFKFFAQWQVWSESGYREGASRFRLPARAAVPQESRFCLLILCFLTCNLFYPWWGTLLECLLVKKDSTIFSYEYSYQSSLFALKFFFVRKVPGSSRGLSLMSLVKGCSLARTRGLHWMPTYYSSSMAASAGFFHRG